jgi:hypothetical protein
MTLEAKIAAMVAIGVGLESIQAELELDYPKTMLSDEPVLRTLSTS